MRTSWLVLGLVLGAACAKEDEPPPYVPTPLPTTCSSTQEGNQRCSGALVQTCTSGTWATTTDCRATAQTCQAAGTTAACVTSGGCACDVSPGACDVGCACDVLCGGGGGGGFDFCVDSWTALCNRAFTDCGTELDWVAEDYTSAVECAADSGCSPDLDESYDYVPANGSACLTLINTSACSAFLDDEPEVCTTALVEKPFSGTCTTITLGMTNGELTAADPLYTGGHTDAYCIALTSGQSVTITTSTGGGGAVEDTILYLLDASGAVIAEDDDGGDGYYSQIVTTITASGTYTILVSGYDESELGTYALSVAAD